MPSLIKIKTMCILTYEIILVKLVRAVTTIGGAVIDRDFTVFKKS